MGPINCQLNSTRVLTAQKSKRRFARTKPLNGPFLFDENTPMQVVTELRRLGHDVLTSMDAGKANSGAPDVEVLALAAAEGRILLTHNRRHFLRLHQHRTADHAGIVICTFDPVFTRQAERIDAAVAIESDTTSKVVRNLV